MAKRLSDDELRRALLDQGENVGPITPTTRYLWEKKLKNLQKRQGTLSPGSQSPLNAFSSDDSEIESNASTRTRRRRTLSRKDSPSERLSLGRLSPAAATVSDDTIFKRPSPVNMPIAGRRPSLSLGGNSTSLLPANKVKSRKSLGRLAAYDVETSDSDMDPDGSASVTSRLKLSRAVSTPSSSRSSLLGVSLRRSPGVETPGRLFPGRSVDSGWSPESKLLYNFSPTHSPVKPDRGYQSNGFLGNRMSNGEFHEEKLQGSSTNYSHCVSWMLVLGAVLFFALIGTLYMSEVQKSSQSAGRNYSKFCGRMDEEKCKVILSTSRDLHKILTAVAGKYDCDTKGFVKRRNLTVAEAKSMLSQELSGEIIQEASFDEIFTKSVNILLNHDEFGIMLHLPPGIENGQDKPNLCDSCALEAKYAAKSLWCRLRLSLQWTTSRLLILCAFICVISLSYAGLCLWRKRREAQEKLFYEMVEKAIDILQDPNDASFCLSELGPYKAVVNVRDALIPPKERKGKLWLWDRVAAFIEENESRVSVEYQKINGEDFKVWRWNSASAAEGEGKQGKVWQGQAFNSLGKEKNSSYSPTPCLKIRNMFDSEVEYGNDWQVNIKDAILEKCEGNDGIRHIAVDASSNEGCVYMLCDSSDSAGKAFDALHGWWFDGKLVTVKYIRYKRYLERYPSAEHCTEPLRPSNNKRLSLSTPFFTSALERS